jgi:hypothetical protein
MFGRNANNKLERIWKEAVVGKLQVLSQYSHGGAEEKDDRSQLGLHSTMLVTTWREILFEKLTVAQLVKKFP